jgi:hypothetical protein
MIPIERLHYKLDMKLNKLASNEHQQISREDKDFAIHEGQLRLIKKKLGPNNGYGIGFDGFRKRYQDLEFLVVRHEELSVEKDKDTVGTYSASLKDLTNQFFLPVDSYITAKRDNCTDRIVVIENIAPHSDVPLYLSSPDLQPSFAYQATFAVISSGSFIVYTADPDGKFEIEKLLISYLRYPTKPCIGDYEDFDGTLLPKVDCEFPEFLEDELLDIAVEQLALATENTFAAQAAQLRAKDGE